MAKVYTKTGDKGTTSLVGGKRVSKASPRLEAYGTVDELNSSIGLLIALGGMPQRTLDTLQLVQHKLFNLGSQLATEPESKWQPQGITADDVAMLEAEIDDVEAQLPQFRKFILPGGAVPSAQANVARTVARRAERRMVEMDSNGCPVAPEAMQFINRLSDYLFVVSRQINFFTGNDEIFWNKSC